jgi:hypothetical protein
VAIFAGKRQPSPGMVDAQRDAILARGHPRMAAEGATESTVKKLIGVAALA